MSAEPACAAPHVDRLTLVVPGAEGGGWDLTAQAMKAALEREGIVGRVAIVRYPGTGGLVGLSEFVERDRGRDDMLLVGGLAMLGAAVADQSAVSVRDVVPVARLTGDWSLVAVRADSPLRDLNQLKRTMLTRGVGLRWSGGSLGGPDQALVWRMANSVGEPLDEVSYYGKVGGRHVAEALLDGRSDVAVSGYAEFAPYVQRSRFRLLGVAAPRRLPGIAAPTLRENGMNVSIMNWRGVFAAPGLTDSQRERLAAVVTAMVATPTWRTALRKSRWSDAYLDARGFAPFIEREAVRWPTLIDAPARSAGAAGLVVGSLDREVPWTLAAAVGLAICAMLLVTTLKRRWARETVLESECRQLKSQLARSEAAGSKIVLSGIEDDFGEWRLSVAERDIAWFMLRGLPMKQIAGLRGTSERTVRQQAQAIYRKAGLESRSDLAGRVLERFI